MSLADISTFTVRGGRNGSQVSITWTEGEFTGDPPTVDLVLVESELAQLHPDDHQSWAGITYADTEWADDALKDPTSAWRLIKSVLDSVHEIAGDVPPVAAEWLAQQRGAP